MTDESNTNTPDYLGQGVRGPLWTTAGVGIGAEGRPDGIDTQKLAAALTGGFAAVPTITFEKFGLKLTFKQGDADAYLAALGAA